MRTVKINQIPKRVRTLEYYKNKNECQLKGGKYEYLDYHKEWYYNHRTEILRKQKIVHNIKEYKIKRREYLLINKEKFTNYRRKTTLGTSKINGINGEIIHIRGLNKRDYPKDNKCELCGRIFSRLSYHHWDNNIPDLGIWVCTKPCHWLAETLDSVQFEQLKNKYLNLKLIINNEKKIEMVVK